MKKAIVSTLLLTLLVAGVLVGCGRSSSGAIQESSDAEAAAAETDAEEMNAGELTKITVAAKPTPHAEIQKLQRPL